MSFEGSLESFGIAEIFQLIASQAKTGVLELSTDEGVAVVRFVRGQLFDALPAQKDPNNAIGTILLRAGYITNKQLNYALEMQQRNLRRLGDTLIRMGAIRTYEFQSMLALQRREMAFRLLRTRRGRYKFTPTEVEFEEGVDSLLNVDSILMEGSRQIDEWPAVLALIPSDKHIFKRVKKTKNELEDDLNAENKFVLNLVDGERTVRQIIERSRLGEFNTWDALAKFFDMGLITPVKKDKKKKATVTKKAFNVPPMVSDLLFTVVLLAGASVALYYSEVWVKWSEIDLGRMTVEASEQFREVERRNLEWGKRKPHEWPK